MAKITCPNLDVYSRRLQSLSKATDGLLKYASYDAADIVCGAVKAATPEKSGDLREHCILVPYENKDGYVYTKVTYAGYDEEGAPNIVKARVLEHGRSKVDGGITGKHPYIAKAVRSVKKRAEESIRRRLDEKLDELMNKE